MWLSKVSSSQFSLEFFLYCVAFQLYTVTISPSGLRDPDPLPSDMYYASPAKFLNHVASSVKSCDLGGGWSMEQEPWITLLKKYQRMLEDHNQTETLLDLGLGTCPSHHNFTNQLSGQSMEAKTGSPFDIWWYLSSKLDLSSD